MFQFALPRGERHCVILEDLKIKGFNSRSRVGSDLTHGQTTQIMTSFNSRSRVGSDRHLGQLRLLPRSFNSRSRVGSDLRLSLSL